MRRKAVVIITVLLVCLVGTQGAFPWGSLTHAFITSQIVTQDGVIRGNAVYGSTAPDFANYMFGSPYQTYLEDRTHNDFLRVWYMASGAPAQAAERAVALGFVAHNEEDYTAHSMSLTLDPGQGYVVQKAAILNEALAGYGVWDLVNLGGEQYAALRAELSHQLIEFAGDILVAMRDPSTGQLLSSAARWRDPGLPALLTRAYAGNLVAYSNRIGIRLNQPAASSVVTVNESLFQGGMISYGGLFQDGDIVQNVAVYLTQLAGMQGIELGDPTLVKQVLEIALSIIGPDFKSEIDATIPFVIDRLALDLVGNK